MDNPKQNLSELLTRREAAEFFRISLPTLHKWTNEQLIRAYEIGGRVYYKRQELIRSLRQRG
jgi:excisionase family DNA binding protein